MEKTLDANQPREQAGFRKGFATTDHLHTINQIIEKSNEFNLPLCIAYIDYEKSFDSVEHEVIFQALRNIGINEIYINIIEDIYNEAKAKVHIEKQESEEVLDKGTPYHQSYSQQQYKRCSKILILRHRNKRRKANRPKIRR